MLRHHHGIGNIDFAMANKKLDIDNGLGTLGRRGTCFLRLEEIAQYSMQLQHDMITASGAYVDKAWSDLSLYVTKRLHYTRTS